VNYFNNTRPQDPVSQILLTGGGSLLSGIAGALSEITHVPVVAADPFSMVAVPRKKNAKKIQLDGSISVALGLALRSAI
jgi:type IV pilus assembly protein PilM